MLDPNVLATVAGILGISARDLWTAYRAHAKSADDGLEDERLARRYEATQQIVQRGLLTQTLRTLYPNVDLVESSLSPVDIVVSDRRQLTSIVVPKPALRMSVPLDIGNDSYHLVPKPSALPSPSVDEVAQLLERTERRGVRLWNEPVYSLAEIDVLGATLRAGFYLDQFYAFRFGIGALEDELVDALIDVELDPTRVRMESLPLRSKYLPTAASVAALRARYCVGGLGVVLALAHDGEFVIPLQRRARTVSDAQGMLSVLPKAFHQPFIDPVGEIALSRTVYREIYEELFGGMEVERTRRRIRYDWYQQSHPALKWFVDHKGAFQMECVCHGINLAQGGFEFGILLAVPDEQYWRTFSQDMMTNWEILEQGVPLVHTKQPGELATVLMRREWAPESLFTLAYGLTRLQELYPGRVQLPDFEITV